MLRRPRPPRRHGADCTRATRIIAPPKAPVNERVWDVRNSSRGKGSGRERWVHPAARRGYSFRIASEGGFARTSPSISPVPWCAGMWSCRTARRSTPRSEKRDRFRCGHAQFIKRGYGRRPAREVSTHQPSCNAGSKSANRTSPRRGPVGEQVSTIGRLPANPRSS